MDSLKEDIRSRALGARMSGDQTKICCPACSRQRKGLHRSDPTLSIKVETDRVLYHCWHCDIKGMVPLNGETKVQNVVAMRPVPLREEPAAASEEALAWLETVRHIPRELARQMCLVSAGRFIRGQFGETPCIGFAYRDAGQTYAVKWRSYPEKAWTQDGAAQTLYLADTVPIGGDLIISEGELDALSFHAAGHPACSIPSGGINLDAKDDSAKLRWMSTHDELLAKAPRIYLAVDNDAVGGTTAQELARRLGKGRCYQVHYPPGCKDANDTLVQHGVEAVRRLLETATPWPVEGVRSVSEIADRVLQLYDRGLPPGLSTTWTEVDKLFTVSPGNLVIVTGTPGSGKSAWLDDLLVRMMLRHQFKVGWASFENPVDIHISKLLQLWRLEPFGKGRPERMTEGSVREGLAWLNDRCGFIDLEETPTPQGLWDRFDALVRRLGINAAVIDPVNFVKMTGDGDTESINRFLAEAKMFARTRELTLFIVAHPAKPFAPPQDWVPTGYSISGSAHWFNRADFGITLARRQHHTELHVWKARFAHQGRLGSVNLVFDPLTASYEVQREPAMVIPKHWQDDPF
jgi:twinkle protein